ncbi:MAG: hypothetical protein IKI21_11520 [Oscillospiraceae bacterium]|nr:hypothetical protein [Oscillospiraceae bacterium]
MFCQRCGKEIPDGEAVYIDGFALCEDCAAAPEGAETDFFEADVIEADVVETAVIETDEDADAEADEDDPEVIDVDFSDADDPPPPDPPDEDAPPPMPEKPRLPVWQKLLWVFGGLLFCGTVVAILFYVHVLCIHDWIPAGCETPETCRICGMTRGDVGGHDWRDADCTTPVTCDICGATEGSPLGHDWQAPDCTTPITCARCGATDGEPLGHDWQDADCEHPRTCALCGETEGEPLGHDWKDADCTTPKTCKRCGATEGDPLGHDWQDADCTTPKTCKVCGETEGEPAGHQWADATLTTPKTCTVCGETEGTALDIATFTPLELMHVSKDDYVEAADAYYKEAGCDACVYSGYQDTMMSRTFPDYCLAYNGQSDGPDHIHVWDGKVTASTYVGMTYNSLVATLGKPKGYTVDEDEGWQVVYYEIDGVWVHYYFRAKTFYDEIVDYLSGHDSGVTIYDGTLTVKEAMLSDSKWYD